MNKNLFNYIKTPNEDATHIKENTRYYLSIFKRNKMGDWFPSWNWACFFASFMGFEFAWLFYRRMYFYGILVGLGWVTFFELLRVKLGLFLIMHLGLVAGKSMMWILKIIWVFTFTLYGNALYGKHINQQLAKGKSESGTDPYTPLILIFLVYTIGTYAIMKLMHGNINGEGVQDMLNTLMKKNESHD